MTVTIDTLILSTQKSLIDLSTMPCEDRERLRQGDLEELISLVSCGAGWAAALAFINRTGTTT